MYVTASYRSWHVAIKITFITAVVAIACVSPQCIHDALCCVRQLPIFVIAVAWTDLLPV